jgi:uncharacterized membrane protein YcaP (DUF421 family)
MQPWEIHLYDWVRILFGNVPPEFFIELVIRVTFIYLLIIFCIRMMGKRMAAQLSRNELVAISSLAASIGIPIQSPERGLLPAVIVALIVVAAQRIVSARIVRNERFERRSQGNISILVNDCCLQPQILEKARISRTEVFARLRSMKIMHMGQVKRLYFEASGDFTLVKNDDGHPGLSVLPQEDPEFLAEQTYSKDIYVCSNCGRGKQNLPQCSNCGNEEFVPAAE